MQKHTKVYLKHFNFRPGDWIPCEFIDDEKRCQAGVVDVHHIERRSSFGSKRMHLQDHIDNLIGLCRDHHDVAHGPKSRETKELLKRIVSNRKV